MRILFITSNRIGDAVLSSGALEHLISAYPQARLTVVCGPVAAPLFRAVPGLERLVAMEKRRFAAHWWGLWRRCVLQRWEVVVDLRNSVVGWLVPRRHHYAHRRSRGAGHKVEEIACLLKLQPPPAPRLWLDGQALAAADALMPPAGTPVLALGPTANWLGKEWPATDFAELARRLTSEDGILPGARVAVFAAPGEEGRAAPLLAALGARAIDLAGRTDPLAAAACLSRVALYVGNDSGLMHIAAAVGAPTLGLFGPGYPEVYGPWGVNARAVVSAEPRDQLFARWKSGPREGDRLMAGLSVDAVTEAATRLWRERRGGRDGNG